MIEDEFPDYLGDRKRWLESTIPEPVSISVLEERVEVEARALERAYTTGNPVAIALFQGSLKRATDALTAAVVADSER